MAKYQTCDACGQRITEDNPIIAKLWLTPVLPGKRADHSGYTSHMDVGKCCADTVVRKLGWRKRQSRKGESNVRRLRPAAAVEAGGGRQAGA